MAFAGDVAAVDATDRHAVPPVGLTSVRSAGGWDRHVGPYLHAVMLRPVEQQPRRALGQRSDGERWVDAEGCRHARAIGHEDARVTAQLMSVVTGGQRRVV